MVTGSEVLPPLPFLSAWDPRAAASGSIDPLGALRPFTAIATTLLPGVTTITSRVRYLSWICAGLSLLDKLPNAPSGGRAGRARRQRLLSWERLVALATGNYAKAVGAAEDDPYGNSSEACPTCAMRSPRASARRRFPCCETKPAWAEWAHTGSP